MIRMIDIFLLIFAIFSSNKWFESLILFITILTEILVKNK